MSLHQTTAPTRQCELYALITKLAASIEARHFNSDGNCTNLGKFEGQTLATIYYYQHDDDVYFSDEPDGASWTIILNTSAIERQVFGAPACQPLYILESDEQGFIFGSWIDHQAAEAIRNSRRGDIGEGTDFTE